MTEVGTATISDDGTRIALAGDWTLEHLPALIAKMPRWRHHVLDAKPVILDASALGKLDTAGATLLLDLAGDNDARIEGMQTGAGELLDAVAGARREAVPAIMPHASVWLTTVARIGASTEAFWQNTVALIGFIGLILSALARSVFDPRRWRMTATVFHVEQTGLDAVPIVGLLCFLVGAVVAFLGATVLKDFGASIYTVELIGYSFLREFGVLLTAIMVAGRSGSAFTAQIGSMKAREEIDAIRTMGLEPVDVLVLPRVLALLVSMPILTLIGMLAGIVGGAVVSAFALDISPIMFITRLHETTAVRHFWVGMSKAPIFAFLIAAIGCLEGFKVAGSAESVGRHTTSSVVQSIFVVILIDALAAIFFMEIDL
ncbi:MAG: MlaE family lipid ABC transporter permease subunit [Dokdonella sp.]